MRIRNLMVGTVQHLMKCGPNIVYGYTQSDEISLLFHPGDMSFRRKMRKLNSILTGEASAKFSLFLGDVAAFDCRISELPNEELVIDYFRWRQEDASRNALNGHCYWLLRKQGLSKSAATSQLAGLANSRKHDLLMASGVNFNNLPAWQKRGIGIYRKTVEKVGVDPRTGAENKAIRNVVFTDLELPYSTAYDHFIRNLFRSAGAEEKFAFVKNAHRRGRRADDRAIRSDKVQGNGAPYSNQVVFRGGRPVRNGRLAKFCQSA